MKLLQSNSESTVKALESFPSKISCFSKTSEFETEDVESDLAVVDWTNLSTLLKYLCSPETLRSQKNWRAQRLLVKTAEEVIRNCPKFSTDAVRVLLSPLQRKEAQNLVLPVKHQVAESMAVLVATQLFNSKMRNDINLSIITDAALANSS